METLPISKARPDYAVDYLAYNKSTRIGDS